MPHIEYQVKGLGIQEQAARKTNGHTIIAVCENKGLGGTLDAQERPGLLRALNTVRSGEATALLVPSLDRLGRTLTVQEAALAQVWNAGGRVYSADEGEIQQDDPADPMRTAIRQVRGVMHQLDKALISKRLCEGRRAKAAEGDFVGGTLPYGFRLEAGQVLPDADEQVVVEVVRKLHGAGKSLREIGRHLADAGYRPRSGGDWQPNQVRRIVAMSPEPAGRDIDPEVGL